MPTPKDKPGICRFLGAINYLSKFCLQLSRVTHPLRNLTKDGIPFLCSDQHQQEFAKAKTLASSAPSLPYENVNALVVLQVDTSNYGLEAASNPLNPTRKQLRRGFIAARCLQLQKPYPH